MDMFVARTMHGVVRNAALYAQGRYRISPLDGFLWTSCLDRDMMGDESLSLCPNPSAWKEDSNGLSIEYVIILLNT
jgi:hypothetical protein